MSEDRQAAAEVPVILPCGSVVVGTAKMRDGRPAVIVALPTGVLIPLIQGRAE